jgi:hypothetical protein
MEEEEKDNLADDRTLGEVLETVTPSHSVQLTRTNELQIPQL